MGWNNWTDEPTTEFTDSELEEHDAEVRSDERKKAELDFQNGEYWNDYLEKVIADAKADAINEYKNKIIDLLCVKDEDYDQPILSPKFLKDYLEQMLMD